MFLSKSELSYDPAVLTTADIIDIIRAAAEKHGVTVAATRPLDCAGRSVAGVAKGRILRRPRLSRRRDFYPACDERLVTTVEDVG